MEGFMNNLAQKFNAQDIINANAQAEAAEFEKTQRKLEEYEIYLKKMQNHSEVNAHNIEKLNQVAQSIGSSELHLKSSIQEIIRSIELSEQQLRNRINEVLRMQEVGSGAAGTNFDDRQLKNQLEEAVKAIAKTNEEQLQMRMEEVISSVETSGEQLQGRINEILQISEKAAKINQNVVANTAIEFDEELLRAQLESAVQSVIKTSDEQLKTQLEDAVQSIIKTSEERLKLQLEDTFKLVNQSNDGGLQAGLSEAIHSIELGQKKLSEQVQFLSSTESKSTGVQVEPQIEQLVEVSIAKIRELESCAVDTQALEVKIEEAIAAIKKQSMTKSAGVQGYDPEQFTKLEEYFHRESVKVYRNVQASVREENQKQVENLQEVIKTETKAIEKIKASARTTLLLVLFVLILQVLAGLNLL